MTYYGGKELAASFRTVRKNTIIAASEIPEDRYSFRATPDTRTVAEQLVHIGVTPRIQQQIQKVERRTTLQGFNFPAIFAEIIAEEKKPRTKPEILSLLEKDGEEFAAWMETLQDGFLGEQVGMPEGASPATKSRFEMLLSLKEHEMHHRSQVMLMQRMIGIVPHGTRVMAERMAQMQAQAPKPAGTAAA
jgi:uncharacterized damage-inducible protein DinB